MVNNDLGLAEQAVGHVSDVPKWKRPKHDELPNLSVGAPDFVLPRTRAHL
jgi:hypothetical protein